MSAPARVLIFALFLISRTVFGIWVCQMQWRRQRMRWPNLFRMAGKGTRGSNVSRSGHKVYLEELGKSIAGKRKGRNRERRDAWKWMLCLSSADAKGWSKGVQCIAWPGDAIHSVQLWHGVVCVHIHSSAPTWLGPLVSPAPTLVSKGTFSRKPSVPLIGLWHIN